MGRLNLKTTKEASRKDSYSMNPDDIQIIWEENVRDGYDTQKYQDLKNMIREDKQIIYPVFVTPREDGNGWKLAHGFSRLRILYELREEGINITDVPVKQVYNKEEICLLHIKLNNSTSELSDVELAKTIREYSKMTGIESPTVLAEKTGLSYQKVRVLLGFDEMASTVLKEAVKNDDISFTAAAGIALNSNGIAEQNERLEVAKEKAKEAGKKRVTGTIANQATGKAPKTDKKIERLRALLVMNGNYGEVVRVIDNMNTQDNCDLLTILKTEIDTLS